MFDIREGEEPSPGGGDWQFPDSAHKVLENLETAVNTFNMVNYLSCLDSADFEFLADEALRLGPNGYLYQNWDYDKEQELVNELFNSLDYGQQTPIFLDLQFTAGDSGPVTYRYSAAYEISVSFADGNAIFAAGSSDFHVTRLASGLWFLSQWLDFKRDTLTLSFAEVKVQDL